MRIDDQRDEFTEIAAEIARYRLVVKGWEGRLREEAEPYAREIFGDATVDDTTGRVRWTVGPLYNADGELYALNFVKTIDDDRGSPTHTIERRDFFQF